MKMGRVSRVICGVNHARWGTARRIEHPLPPMHAGTVISPYQRVMMFVDNAGADVVLGMLPFARELLRMGAEARIMRTLQILCVVFSAGFVV